MWRVLLLAGAVSEILGSSVRDDGFQKTLGHLKPQTSAEVQTKAAEDLIVRILGKDANYFKAVVNSGIGPVGKDTFKLEKVDNNTVQITGTSGVAVAWGLYYYLKNYCGCHVSWEGSQLRLPQVLPDVDETVISNDRYYQNVCTPGYSSTWWKWPQWEKNIDWMALNGYNLALAFTAQEAIWNRVYLGMNLTQQEIDQHFGGPAFLPWARMGNFRGWGGPLSQDWHTFTVELQHSILTRMRELGIVPVLPAFAGHVPREFARVYPDAKVTKVHSWNGFEDAYCCPNFLEPTDPLFRTVGSAFLKEYIKEFGTDHVYNCDSFNENMPRSGDVNFLGQTSSSIFAAMRDADPDAIWLMQGWLFVHNHLFWTKERARAYLTAVPIGKMIILDLQSEQEPQYQTFYSYFGQPFIWCMLHNFGGTLGLFGSSEIINKRVFEARNMKNSTMIGTGLTPEGIFQNYVIYELMNEQAYRREPIDLTGWFSNYAIRRYGHADDSITAAWSWLGLNVYNYKFSRNVRGHYVITRRPSLGIQPWYWYNLQSFWNSWKNFLDATDEVKRSELYKHDLVDITRQALQITADFIYRDIKESVKKENMTKFRTASVQLLELFDDLEAILASSPDFLLGSWLESAKEAAPTPAERANFEFNARNQITLWGPNGEIMDYANKQWSGVVKDYFRPRWDLFLTELESSLIKHRPLDAQAIKRRIFDEVEMPFSYSTKVYPKTAKGDSVEIAARLYDKWSVLWP